MSGRNGPSPTSPSSLGPIAARCDEGVEREVEPLLLDEARSLDDAEPLPRGSIGNGSRVRSTPIGTRERGPRTARPSPPDARPSRGLRDEEPAPYRTGAGKDRGRRARCRLREVSPVERRDERDLEPALRGDGIPSRPAEVGMREDGPVLPHPLDDSPLVVGAEAPNGGGEPSGGSCRCARRRIESVHRIERELVEVAGRPGEDDRREALLVPEERVDEGRRPGKVLRHDVCHDVVYHRVDRASFRGWKSSAPFTGATIAAPPVASFSGAVVSSLRDIRIR